MCGCVEGGGGRGEGAKYGNARNEQCWMSERRQMAEQTIKNCQNGRNRQSKVSHPQCEWEQSSSWSQCVTLSKDQHQVLPGLHFRTDSLGLSISASHRTINCFYSKHFVKGQKESLVTPTPPWSTNSPSQSDGKTDFIVSMRRWLSHQHYFQALDRKTA